MLPPLPLPTSPFVLNYLFFFQELKNSSIPFSFQSIGFIGPGIALIGLASAKSASIASAWLTLAVGLKSFSHSGFLVNLQVGGTEQSNQLPILALLKFSFLSLLYRRLLHNTLVCFMVRYHFNYLLQPLDALLRHCCPFFIVFRTNAFNWSKVLSLHIF